MKKGIKIIFSSSLIFLLFSCGNSLGEVVGEYKGDIYFGESVSYDLGVNKENIVIFKDIDKAFEEILKEEEPAFKEIEKQFNLKPISKDNWQGYKTYGWQLVTEDEDLKDSASRITKFFDIYENSFTSN